MSGKEQEQDMWTYPIGFVPREVQFDGMAEVKDLAKHSEDVGQVASTGGTYHVPDILVYTLIICFLLGGYQYASILRKDVHKH